MPPLKHLEIKGFKSIKDMNLELKSLNVLIGANGAGKSNFISFFNMLNEIVNKNLQTHVVRSGGADKFLYFGKKETEKIILNLSFDDNKYSAHLEPTKEDSLFFSHEYTSYHDKKYPRPWEQVLGSGHKETKLFDVSRSKRGYSVADQVISSLKDWRVYHFHDTSDSAKVKGICDINDNRILKSDASNLAAFLYKLKNNHEKHYKNILRTVQLVAPFIDEFILEPLELNKEKIRLEWKHKSSDGYFNINQLSDGTIRTICIATLLLQPVLPSTILIDEPELGLHPYAITILASLLTSVSEKTQIIASTQSLLLVDLFEPEDLVVVDYEVDSSSFKRVDADKLSGWLDEYSLGDLWEKNILGGRPR